MIKVPCCSPLPEAKDGVEPSFQDLQSDTFPLCYLAKPATSCAKVKRLFFLPRSLFFYICGGGRSALYDRRRVTREEGTTDFSLALLNLPFLISSSKQLRGSALLRTPAFEPDGSQPSFAPLVSKGEFLSCLAQKQSLFSLEKDSPAARQSSCFLYLACR